MGRDLNIGIPPKETIDINITTVTPVITAIEKNTAGVETTAQEIRKVRSVEELILGEEVYGIEDE
jgi:hypothetical protein